MNFLRSKSISKASTTLISLTVIESAVYSVSTIENTDLTATGAGVKSKQETIKADPMSLWAGFVGFGKG